MAILLAAASAVVYGSGDFFGGLAARRVPAFVVAFVSQCVGLAALLAVTLVWPDSAPTASDWAWGAAAGVAGGLGIAAFYWALSTGPMAVTAPITAVISATIPAFVGVATGDRPGAVSWIGVAAAVPAIGLVARADNPEGSENPGGAGSARRVASRTVAAAAAAGVAFGIFFVAFARTGSQAGLWPLVAARLASISVLAALLVARREPARTPADHPAHHLGTSWLLLVAAGVFDTTANGLYLLATRSGALSLVAVVSAMYPASTVVLARLVLREHLARWQIVGLALAAVAVGLVAVGR